MFQKFKEFNQSGIEILIDLNEYPYTPSNNVDFETLRKFRDGSLVGLGWEFNGLQILIEDKSVSVQGYPSVALDYMVVVYQGTNGRFLSPNNAVVYNLDGTIHRILEMPKILSKNILRRIDFYELPNPPLSDIGEDGLAFGGFGWSKNEKGEMLNSIAITYDREWYENRLLNPETGEIGELIDSGRL